MTKTEALQRALVALHQSVYGYGLGGAHLRSATARRWALQRLADQQQLRDQVARLLLAAGGTPTPPAPAYQPPSPVVDEASALRLFAELESAASGAAWDVVATSTHHDAARREGVQWLTDAGRWAWTWSSLAEGGSGGAMAEFGPALPGQPG